MDGKPLAHGGRHKAFTMRLLTSPMLRFAMLCARIVTAGGGLKPRG